MYNIHQCMEYSFDLLALFLGELAYMTMIFFSDVTAVQRSSVINSMLK